MSMNARKILTTVTRKPIHDVRITMEASRVLARGDFKKTTTTTVTTSMSAPIFLRFPVILMLIVLTLKEATLAPVKLITPVME